MPPTQRRSTSIGPTGRPPKRDAGGGAVVGDGVENLARILQTRIDDLDRRDDVFGRAQHVGQADARTLQALAHDEGQFDLDARLAVIGMQDLGAVADHLVVEDIAVIRLVDHRGALHRLRGQADLVADQSGAGRDLAILDHGRDRVGILDLDIGISDRKLHRLFMLGLGLHQDIGAVFTVGFRKHGPGRSLVVSFSLAASRGN